ncbi:FmdB family zinc ribbon protein [Kitasatospora sp. NPDC088346]|uniref:FmdB family zinc ribbon protein n=1 Tax=Kitasatospora sp. NPDC088346 TaxID=3364073 RepID=UPI0037F987F8
MPTYQYQCTECGTGLEAVQKFTDEALTTCPECQGKLRKVFSAVGVVFKGSGFYRTDSRSSSSSSVTSGTSSSSSTGSAASTGSSGSSSGGSSSSSSTSSSAPASAPAAG